MHKQQIHEASCVVEYPCHVSLDAVKGEGFGIQDLQ